MADGSAKRNSAVARGRPSQAAVQAPGGPRLASAGHRVAPMRQRRFNGPATAHQRPDRGRSERFDRRLNRVQPAVGWLAFLSESRGGGGDSIPFGQTVLCRTWRFCHATKKRQEKSEQAKKVDTLITRWGTGTCCSPHDGGKPGGKNRLAARMAVVSGGSLSHAGASKMRQTTRPKRVTTKLAKSFVARGKGERGAVLTTRAPFLDAR
jgi:hypothetical protein